MGAHVAYVCVRRARVRSPALAPAHHAHAALSLPVALASLACTQHMTGALVRSAHPFCLSPQTQAYPYVTVPAAAGLL
eukprot:scaffold615_cov125-Isochrysis_galbana.AAC.3